jgi:hypothetical protein
VSHFFVFNKRYFLPNLQYYFRFINIIIGQRIFGASKNTLIEMVSRGGLVIVAMRHMSREPLQFPIQNVQKEAFCRSFDGLLDFF